MKPSDSPGSPDSDLEPCRPIEFELEVGNGTMGHVFVDEKPLVFDEAEAEKRDEVWVAELAEPVHLGTEWLFKEITSMETFHCEGRAITEHGFVGSAVAGAASGDDVVGVKAIGGCHEIRELDLDDGFVEKRYLS